MGYRFQILLQLNGYASQQALAELGLNETDVPRNI
jgi:hypothetical protein